MSLERLARNRIDKAAQAGLFDNLEGSGKPLAVDPADALAGENWMGFKILKDASMLPEWLALAREIEAGEERLRELDRRHAEWVARVAEGGEWERFGHVIERLRATYEKEARVLRAKQDRFNLDAPSVALERPAIWVEHRLGRLDARLAEARAAAGADS